MKILVPIEEEKFADAICAFLSKHEWSDSTEMTVLHVIQPMMLDHPMASYPVLLETVTKDMRDYGDRLLLKYSEKLKKLIPNVIIKTKLLEGIPAPSLVQEAACYKPDLIVMGSHGRTGLDRFFMGSVSYEVACQAPCSVAIVRLPMKESSAGTKARDEASMAVT